MASCEYIKVQDWIAKNWVITLRTSLVDCKCDTKQIMKIEVTAKQQKGNYKNAIKYYITWPWRFTNEIKSVEIDYLSCK